MFYLLLILFGAASAVVQDPVDFGPRIFDERDLKAVVGQFPWHVYLKATYLSENNTYMESSCGGSIISKEWILTAAHCLTNAIRVKVYAGIVNLTFATPPTSVSTEFITYKGNISNKDIALIKLPRPLQLNRNISPIALSSEHVPSGVEVTAIGAGRTHPGDKHSGHILKYTDLVTLEKEKCQYYPKLNLLCAAGQDNNICPGDSGGSLFTYTESQEPVLVGVTIKKFKPECEAGSSGYSRIATFRDWIKSNTGV